MNSTELFIIVKGGVVYYVSSTGKDVKVNVIDLDCEPLSEEFQEMYEKAEKLERVW